MPLPSVRTGRAAPLERRASKAARFAARRFSPFPVPFLQWGVYLSAGRVTAAAFSWRLARARLWSRPGLTRPSVPVRVLGGGPPCPHG